MAVRTKQLLAREIDINNVLDEITSGEALKKIELSGVKLALNKLVVSGHSFGGITAISAAYADDRVKACVTFDPWLFVYEKNILEGKMKQKKPMMAMTTENFATDCKYDMWKA